MASLGSSEELKAAFAIFDVDADGYLTPAELRRILTRPSGGQPALLTDEDVDKLVSEFDTNGDGVLSVDEFAQAMASLSTGEQASFEQLIALVAASPEETFDDLVTAGGGCIIPRTAERAITLQQLLRVKVHIERRCSIETWLNWKRERLAPKRVSLYEACAHVIKPATHAQQVSYV